MIFNLITLVTFCNYIFQAFEFSSVRKSSNREKIQISGKLQNLGGKLQISGKLQINVNKNVNRISINHEII